MKTLISKICEINAMLFFCSFCGHHNIGYVTIIEQKIPSHTVK